MTPMIMRSLRLIIFLVNVITSLHMIQLRLSLKANIAPRAAGTSYYDYAAGDHQGMLARPLIAFSTSSLVNKSPLDNMPIALDPYYYDSAYSSNLPYRATLPSTLKRYPDEVTENSSMTTYEMSVPYTDTADKYGLAHIRSRQMGAKLHTRLVWQRCSCSSGHR